MTDVVLPDAVVLTDAWRGYAPLARHGYTHKPTNIAALGDPAHVVMPGIGRRGRAGRQPELGRMRPTWCSTVLRLMHEGCWTAEAGVYWRTGGRVPV